MIDDRTANLNLPLPNIANSPRGEDVPRIRQALMALDAAVVGLVDDAVTAGSLLATIAQTLDAGQKAQARLNIGAVSAASPVMTGNASLTDGALTVTQTTGSISRLNIDNANRAWSITNYGTQFGPNGSLAFSNETDGVVALALTPEGRLSSPALYLTSAPSQDGTWLGLSQKFTSILDVTATKATTPEGGAHFNLVSSVGAGEPDAAYKTALSASFISQPGSSNGWAQSNVATIASGGVRRGAIALEIDLNNHWGDFTGAIANPYCANLLLTGTNTDGFSGGYGSAAIVISFAQNDDPLWQSGIQFGPGGFNPFAVAALWDASDSPTSLRVTGTHGKGIDMSEAAFGTSAILTPGFNLLGDGTVVAKALSVGGVGPGGILSNIHSYSDEGGPQMLALLENNSGNAETAAMLGFSVTSTHGSEARSAKAGLFFKRSAGNGRGTFGLANRITSDTDDFDADDAVLQWDNTNACQMVIAGTLYNLSVSGGAVLATL